MHGMVAILLWKRSQTFKHTPSMKSHICLDDRHVPNTFEKHSQEVNRKQHISGIIQVGQNPALSGWKIIVVTNIYVKCRWIICSAGCTWKLSLPISELQEHSWVWSILFKEDIDNISRPLSLINKTFWASLVCSWLISLYFRAISNYFLCNTEPIQ